MKLNKADATESLPSLDEFHASTYHQEDKWL